MGRTSPTATAIRWTQRYVLGALGEDAPRTRRSSCLILLAAFVPLGVAASLAFRPGDFTAPASVAGTFLTTLIVWLAATTRSEAQQWRWGPIVVLIAIDQAFGMYQLGPHGIALLPEVPMLGVWTALYLPTRVVRLAIGSICIAVMITLVGSDDLSVTLIAIVVSQITVGAVSLLVHSAVLTLRATNDDLDEARRLAHHLATTDALTGAANRRSFTALVHSLTEVDEPVSHTLLLADIDRFKDLNDQHGHLVGDEVLREVAKRLADALPNADVARWGGEEFVVLFTHEGSDKALARASEQLRSQVASVRIDTSTGPISCTISVGGTTWRASESFEHALRRADAALYEAKASGRNRWVARTTDSVGTDDVRRPA